MHNTRQNVFVRPDKKKQINRIIEKMKKKKWKNIIENCMFSPQFET